MAPLTFKDLRAASSLRQRFWDPDNRFDLLYRSNELGGEVGEAQNVVKKLVRERLGLRGSRSTKDALASELADVVICADLVAQKEDIDLDIAVRMKFNRTSKEQNLNVFLPWEEGDEHAVTETFVSLREVLDIIRDQPLAPDTKVGVRQNWLKGELIRRITAHALSRAKGE